LRENELEDAGAAVLARALPSLPALKVIGGGEEETKAADTEFLGVAA
jgi:hypothetical protein